MMPQSVQVSQLVQAVGSRQAALSVSRANISSYVCRRLAHSSVQSKLNAKEDAVHYSINQHEYGGAACLRDVYTNKGRYRKGSV